MVTEIQRVTDTLAALGQGRWDEVGRIFDASHRSMRDDFEIPAPTRLRRGDRRPGRRGRGPDDRRWLRGSSVAVVPDERVEAVTRAVDAAFVLEGFRAPEHLVATPSAGATVERSAG